MNFACALRVVIAWTIGVAGAVAFAEAQSSGVAAAAPTPATAAAESRAPTVVLVLGAPGEPQYGREFVAQAESWRKAAGVIGGKVVTIGTTEDAARPDRDQLAAALAAEPKEGDRELWVVLVGHGTFNGAEAKFNLRGPDVSAGELAGWLQPFRRPLVVIDTSSSSAPFLAALSAKDRIVITSTRSGFEQNYARFGRFLAEAILDPRSDLDRDGEVSVLEAFLVASRATADFYKTEGRLATEHPLLDDNGDGRGTPAEWFKGVHATRKPEGGAEVDGAHARQVALVRSAAELQLPPAARARRAELERELENLRAAKSTLPESEYFDRLEKLMLDLAAVYEGT